MKLQQFTEEQFEFYSKNHEYSNIYRTNLFSELRFNDDVEEILNFGLRDELNTVAAAKVIITLNDRNKKEAIIPGGMLIDYSDKKVVNVFAQELNKYFKANDISLIKMEMPINTSLLSSDIKVVMKENTQIRDNLKKAGLVPEFCTGNILSSVSEIIDVETIDSSEELQAKANANGISVRMATIYDLNAYKELSEDYSISNEKYELLMEKYPQFKIFIAEFNPLKFLEMNQELLKNESEKNETYNNQMANSSLFIPDLIDLKRESDSKLNTYKQNITYASTIICNGIDKTVILATVAIARYQDTVHFINESHNKDLNLTKFAGNHILRDVIASKLKIKGIKYIVVDDLSKIKKLEHFELRALGSKNMVSGLQKVLTMLKDVA